jgi:hypothetical protein
MMQEPEPVDLSPLDPERDQVRWARVASATRARVAAALATRGREPDLLDVVSGWTRPILAAAAGLLLLLGAAEATAGRSHPAAPRSEARRLAWLSESAVLHDRAPTGAELEAVLRGRKP